MNQPSKINLLDLTSSIDNKNFNIERVTLIVTRGCDLACSYCFEHHNPKEKMSENLAFSIIEKYNPSVIKFFGGEPLVNRSLIKKIIDTYPDKRFEITTNGTYINKITEDYWKQFSSINISLDGLYERDSSRWRDRSEYDRTVENINKLVSMIGTESIICNVTTSAPTMFTYSLSERMDDINKLTGITHFDINLVTFDAQNKLYLTPQGQDLFIAQCYGVFLDSISKDSCYDVTINEAVFAKDGSANTCCAYRAKNQIAVNVNGHESHCHVAAYFNVNNNEFDKFSKTSEAACPMIEWMAKESGETIVLNSLDFEHLSRLEDLNYARYYERTRERKISR